MKRLLLQGILLVLSSHLLGQQTFYDSLSNAALELTNDQVIYDPSYFSMDYPGGDVPANRGVCTDVIIRAYRKLDIDLQKEVHEDMLFNFNEYPKTWGLGSTDKNIDHRRVPNLMVFFKRKGTELQISDDPLAYSAGDLVCWDLGKGITHIGIVVNRRSRDDQRYLVVHNIGSGQVMEDMLFDYRIIGHYRYSNQ